MRSLKLCLCMMLMSFITACGGGGGSTSGSANVDASPLSSSYTSGSNDPGTILKTNSTLVTETEVLDSATTSKLVSSDSTTLVFQAAPDTVKNLKPGAIIIVENVARKVESVATVGDTTTISTTEPEFGQVVDKLEINGDIDLSEAHLIPESVPKGVVFKQTNSSLAKIITGNQGNNFTITITDHVVYDNDGKLNTTWDQVIANGKIELTKPNIKFEYYYGVWHDKYAEMKFTSGEKVSLQLSSKNFKFEKTYKVPLGKFIVPVPVTGGVANMTIDLILVFDASGSASIVAGFSEELSIDQGIKATLNPYNLTTSNNTTFAFNLKEPTFEGNLRASIGINPNINLNLFQYNMTGITNSLALGANATATATVSQACAQLIADAVLSSTGYIMLPKASFEMNFSWNNFKLSADVSMVKKEMEIFSAKKNFYDSGQLCTEAIDVTPPTTTAGPSVSGTTSTGTTMSATINENGTGYYLVQAATASAPSVAAVQSGTSFAMTANVAATLTISGLMPSTAYKIYFVAKDTANKVQSAVSSVSVTTSATADVTPPTTTAGPSVSGTTSTGTTMSATINENGTGYYLVQAATASAPSVAAVQSGTSFAMTANVAATLTISGLMPSTAYKIYFVAKDTANKVQSAVSSVAVTTTTGSTVTTLIVDDGANNSRSVAANVPAYGNVWNSLAQSFTAQNSHIRFGFKLFTGTSTSSLVTYKLYDGENSYSHLLASRTVTAPAVSFQGSTFVDADFTSITLIVGQKYTVEITVSSNALPTTGSYSNVNVVTSLNNPYSGGRFFFPSGYNNDYFSQQDMLFRITSITP